jgi:hypothetical protein
MDKVKTPVIRRVIHHCLDRSRKLRLTTVGDPPRWPRDTPLSTKFGTKFCRQVAVDQSVYFVRGLRATEYVCQQMSSRKHWLERHFICDTMRLTHLPRHDVELSWGIVNKNWSCGQFLKQEYYQSPWQAPIQQSLLPFVRPNNAVFWDVFTAATMIDVFSNYVPCDCDYNWRFGEYIISIFRVS